MTGLRNHQTGLRNHHSQSLDLSRFCVITHLNWQNWREKKNNNKKKINKKTRSSLVPWNCSSVSCAYVENERFPGALSLAGATDGRPKWKENMIRWRGNKSDPNISNKHLREAYTMSASKVQSHLTRWKSARRLPEWEFYRAAPALHEPAGEGKGGQVNESGAEQAARYKSTWRDSVLRSVPRTLVLEGPGQK